MLYIFCYQFLFTFLSLPQGRLKQHHCLKKISFDRLLLENFGPLSNLPLLGKVLEKVAYQQLHMCLSQNNLFDAYQSGFTTNHSTETALVRIINVLQINTANRTVSVLVLQCLG